MPWMRRRWKSRKQAKTDSRVTVEMAKSAAQSDLPVESTKLLRLLSHCCPMVAPRRDKFQIADVGQIGVAIHEFSLSRRGCPARGPGMTIVDRMSDTHAMPTASGSHPGCRHRRCRLCS